MSTLVGVLSVSLKWVNGKHSRRSGVGKRLGIGMFSLKYSVCSGFFSCACWVGGF